jgi:hypothetical protein
MTPTVARLLTRLYPRRWRERYGAEFEAMLFSGGGGFRLGFRTGVDVVWSAFCERVWPTLGSDMVSVDSCSFGAMVRRPSAFLPMAMSLTALALVLGDVAIYGIVREADEGAVAHLWQLLMAGQMPVLAFFAVRWWPRAPRQTMYVLALQAGAALASMAPVFFLGL